MSHAQQSNTPQNTPLQNLKMLFQDRPDVLKMLDLRELDLSNLTDEQLKQFQRRTQLFPEPVNLYATGRTGAGKSSLGNSLFSDDPVNNPVLPTSGRQDCTHAVQYFRLVSNLRYFDLPGAGSNETYENINRAALLIRQLNDPHEKMVPVNEFEVYDFSDPQIERKTTTTITQWNSFDNQLKVAPDIILYVVAPHTQFVRDDRRYLRALLRARIQHDSRHKVIFALNLHRTPEGSLKPTRGNIEDAKKEITEVYQQVYSTKDIPPILEIDSLRGTGISQLTELMCGMLPANKIGNIQQVLRVSLKQYAEEERSRRYRQALIQIAARLATYPVDTPLGKGILQEAYAAVSSYGIQVFIQEPAIVKKAAQELYQLVSDVADKAKISRQEAIKVIEPIIEEMEHKQVVITYTPKIIEREIPETITTIQEVKKSRDVPYTSEIDLAVGRGLGTLVGFAVAGPFGGFAGAVIGDRMARGHRTKTETYTDSIPVQETVTRIQQEFAGMNEKREEIAGNTYKAVVGQKEVVKGKKAKQGGYVVVEDILAIGLGLEMADPSLPLNKQSFERVVRKKRQEVKLKLNRHEQAINDFAENHKPEQAEAGITFILQKAFISPPSIRLPALPSLQKPPTSKVKQTSSSPTAKLVIRTPISRGSITIGNGVGSGLLIRGSSIVQRHAEIGLESGRYVISDYSGGNTLVSFNGDPTQLKPIQKRNALKDSSLIRVGHVTLLFGKSAHGTPWLDVIYELGATGVSIGSSPDQDIILSDPSVSARHAELRQEAGRWTVRDLSSAQGTFVSYKGPSAPERRILRTNALQNGSMGRFGQVPFLFRTN